MTANPAAFALVNAPLGLGILAVTGVFATLPAFILTALLGRPLIARLQRAAARQTAYEDAPKSHQTKTGTPTMGGVLFAIAPPIALLLAPSRTTAALALLVYSCMAIGAVDDLAKIRKQKNKGLRAVPKFALTAAAATAFLLVAGPQTMSFVAIGPVPAWLWYGLSICVVLATTHAVNLTDGLDGLAGGTVVPPLVAFVCIAGILHAIGVAIFAAAVLGAVFGFLVYNRHPARVFMGDTGSLALGGALAGVAVLTGAHLFLLLIGGVFVAETLSVIIQVASYKTTRRRVFRMSPLHHHFELGGWPETKVTSRFWLASLLLSLVGFALIARTT
ncbi:phospho-N-acetylmuramoyl-pentapeptide-transferase [Vulcanimicrobium alpinum]|uniref:Phospho-N-acetylmuramoyl-pentapeptide-transferase n=1 Tax=Vulcanimicrobium alpinum TaxID=3016050 RepID=A0AAN2CBL1_UNVUL|nr:phospho-N-acetylmuramoyl-pentapeptide-transferase [Vulcanimicrobium alpinum]BDE07932.1 phospho-N-acetylmuramoyl-pentapeptide-transferase [Vulcanimicrobium alpinum]